MCCAFVSHNRILCFAFTIFMQTLMGKRKLRFYQPKSLRGGDWKKTSLRKVWLCLFHSGFFQSHAQLVVSLPLSVYLLAKTTDASVLHSSLKNSQVSKQTHSFCKFHVIIMNLTGAAVGMDCRSLHFSVSFVQVSVSSYTSSACCIFN